MAWNAVGVLAAIAGVLVYVLKTFADAVAKSTGDAIAKEALVKLTWPAELGRELQKARGVERQDLRFKSYGALWKELKPFAVYDASTIGRRDVQEISGNLTNWYFSEAGGLLLTSQARDFYFATQDLLRTVAKLPDDWIATRPADAAPTLREHFAAVLAEAQAMEALQVLNYLDDVDPGTWQQLATGYAKQWRRDINRLTSLWEKLQPVQRFACLQQVTSVLRTVLSTDLESRTQ